MEPYYDRDGITIYHGGNQERNVINCDHERRRTTSQRQGTSGTLPGAEARGRRAAGFAWAKTGIYPVSGTRRTSKALGRRSSLLARGAGR